MVHSVYYLVVSSLQRWPMHSTLKETSDIISYARFLMLRDDCDSGWLLWFYPQRCFIKAFFIHDVRLL